MRDGVRMCVHLCLCMCAWNVLGILLCVVVVVFSLYILLSISVLHVITIYTCFHLANPTWFTCTRSYPFCYNQAQD
jgi:hypothetical protein